VSSWVACYAGAAAVGIGQITQFCARDVVHVMHVGLRQGATAAGMLSQKHLGHSARTQQAHDPEASKSFPRAQWHEPHTTNSGGQGSEDGIESVGMPGTQDHDAPVVKHCVARTIDRAAGVRN
jgi:hypothetical protein